jgi:hypothetical protein
MHDRKSTRRDVVWGLAELANFYLASNKLKPKSALFQHLEPPTIDGLYSAPAKVKGGYDGSILWGNFVIVSTELWARPEVRGRDGLQDCLG